MQFPVSIMCSLRVRSSNKSFGVFLSSELSNVLFHHISSAPSCSSHEQRLSASLDEALFSALQGRPSFTSNLSKKSNVTPESEPKNSSQNCQASGTPVMPTGKMLVRPLREILHPKTFACQRILPFTHVQLHCPAVCPR